jgi:hypothetical protein
MMVVVWICFIHIMPLRGRWTKSGHIVPLLWQRITCIPTIDIFRSEVTPDLSRACIRCDVTFSQLYTPCSSETKDVITSKNSICSVYGIVMFTILLCYVMLLTFQLLLQYNMQKVPRFRLTGFTCLLAFVLKVTVWRLSYGKFSRNGAARFRCKWRAGTIPHGTHYEQLPEGRSARHLHLPLSDYDYTAWQ